MAMGQYGWWEWGHSDHLEGVISRSLCQREPLFSPGLVMSED